MLLVRAHAGLLQSRCCQAAAKSCARPCPCPQLLPPRFKENKEGAVLCAQQLDREDLDQFRAAVAEDYYFQVGGRAAGHAGGEGVPGRAERLCSC